MTSGIGGHPFAASLLQTGQMSRGKGPIVITASFTDSIKRCVMGNDVTVWYDREGDHLEVIFERKEGYFRETDNDAVMEKVDQNGHVIGFSINVSQTQSDAPVPVTLRDAAA